MDTQDQTKRIYEVDLSDEEIIISFNPIRGYDYTSILYQSLDSLPNISLETLKQLHSKGIRNRSSQDKQFSVAAFWIKGSNTPVAHLSEGFTYIPYPDCGKEPESYSVEIGFCGSWSGNTGESIKDVKAKKIPFCEKCLRKADYYTSLLEQIASRDWNNKGNGLVEPEKERNERFNLLIKRLSGNKNRIIHEPAKKSYIISTLENTDSNTGLEGVETLNYFIYEKYFLPVLDRLSWSNFSTINVTSDMLRYRINQTGITGRFQRGNLIGKITLSKEEPIILDLAQLMFIGEGESKLYSSSLSGFLNECQSN
jgi:hypothetical protein